MKILAIGNSFSDDAMEYLYPVLSALGETNLFLGNLYIPGCPLSLHLENALSAAHAYDYRTNADGIWHTEPGFPLPQALKSREWDVITMQQASYDSGKAETFDALAPLITYVKNNAPGKPALAWHMTWAYQNGCTHGGFAAYGNDQKRMYDGILNAVKTRVLPLSEFSFVLPAGTAIQNARASFLGDALTRDGYHLSDPLGRYIAALTLARVLTGKTVRGIGYAPAGVTEREKSVAIEAAERAAAEPFHAAEPFTVD